MDKTIVILKIVKKETLYINCKRLSDKFRQSLFFYVVILTVKLSYHEVLRYCFNAREKLYQRKNIKPNNWVIEYIGCNFWNKTLKFEVKTVVK